MALPLLLLLALPLLALLERCLRHSTAHHGVAQRGSVTSQPRLPTAATPVGHCPSPKHHPWHTPHVTSGGRGSWRGGRVRMPHPAPLAGPCAAEAPHLMALSGRRSWLPRRWGSWHSQEQPSPMPVPCFLVQAGAEGLRRSPAGASVGNAGPAPRGFSWELPWCGSATAARCPRD